MVNKLTPKEKEYYILMYRSNESINHHRENAGMLIKLFGTSYEKKKYKQIKNSHIKNRGLTLKESEWLYKHGHKYFYKLLK